MSSVLSLWFICVFWRGVMRDQRAPTAPVYIMTSTSSMFALTLLGVSSHVRWFLERQRQLSEAAPFLTWSTYIHVFIVHVTTALSLLWTSETAVVSATRSLLPWSIFMFSIASHPCSCFPHRKWHIFLFIIIMHSAPAWIDYTRATLRPQFNFLPGGMWY